MPEENATVAPRADPKITREFVGTTRMDGRASVVRRARSVNRHESRRRTPACILLRRHGRIVWQAVQMGQQFVFRGQSAEVVADHLISAKRRLTTRPKADQ